MKRSNIPLIKHIPNFLDYCEIERGLSPVSTRNYHNFLKVFINWLQNHDLSDLKPHELTPDHIWDYRLYLSRKKDGDNYIKKTTQSYYLIAIRILLNYFADKDIISIPSEKIKLPKLTDKDKAIKFLNFEQVEKILNMPDVLKIDGLRDKSMLEVLFSTGMRISELTSLNITQFDKINLLKGKFDDLELSIAGKGGNTRTVYFSNRSLKWIAKYIKTRNDLFTPLFINYSRNNDSTDEHRLTSRSIERLVRKYSVMAGLPVDATPHTLR
ncbi:MAG: tyrosine-type recombinase/integrase, partial [Patescibacteria group bacterium]